METPVCCDHPMVASFIVGERTNWRCQHSCGRRQWTGPVGVRKDYTSPSARLRHCEHCGGALADGAYARTKYHQRCAQTVKTNAQRAYARALRLTRAAGKRHRPSAAVLAAKELDLAGIEKASRRVGRRLVEVVDVPDVEAL